MTLNYDTLRIKSNIKLHSITHAEFQILKNEHARLRIRGIAKDNPIDGSILEQASSSHLGTMFTLYRQGVEEIPIFSGIVEKLNLLKENGIGYFELEVASLSVLLDRRHKKLSFQDVTMTYEELAQQILSEYTDGATICTIGEQQKIGTPLVQYKETDWEFLKRIASHFESVIVPEYKYPYPRVWFGFPNTMDTVKIPLDTYVYGQTEDYFKTGANFSDYTRDDFCFVETQAYEDFELGSLGNFHRQGYVLYEKHGKIENGELVFTYRFGAGGLTKSPKVYNEIISGMSLLGEVAKDDKEDVYVKLDIDNGTGGTYPYPFRPETGNMMYCMPQVGTTVSLYFPSFDEHKAMVVNCFRRNGGDCGQMADPSKRAFTTEHGKELDLYPTQMALKSSTTGSAITLDDDAGLSICTNKALAIVGSEINFHAPIIHVRANLGEINMLKLDPQFPLVTSSVTMSNQFDVKSKGGTELVGRDFVNYLAFDDTPEKKSFVGGLLKNVLAGLVIVGAVALTLATFGAAGPIIVGACIGGAIAVGITAAGDVIRGEVSSTDEYLFAGLFGAITGAISGGISMLKFAKLANLTKTFKIANKSINVGMDQVARFGLEVAEGFTTGAGESIAAQMMLEDSAWEELNWGAVGFNSLINGGIAVAVPVIQKIPVVKKLTDKLENLLPSSGSKVASSQSFSNWDDMKNAHKGTVTDFVKDNKPLGSTHPRDWLKVEGNHLAIDMLEDGTQVWKYIKDGLTVPYVPKLITIGKHAGEIHKVIQFPEEVLFDDDYIQQLVNKKGFSPSRTADKSWALNELKSLGYDGIPKGYVLHHDTNNGVFQIVNEDAHKMFLHYGGRYYNK